MTETAEMQKGDWSDIIVGGVFAALILLGLGVLARHFSEIVPSSVLLLAGMFGAATGWLAGILASPYNPNERGVFAEFGKLVYGFLSGYILSTVEPILRQTLQPSADKPVNTAFALVLTYGLISFMVAV